MTEVRKWLEQNDLGRYGDLFEENQIDGDALLALTDAHLKELAIPLGPRAKLLKAIAALAAQSATGKAPGRASDLVPAHAAATGVERRQLTVMFVDLVGSTTLSGRLDPEDLRKVIRAYQGVVGVEVARYEGHVAQYLGDGVLVYFGYPRAHEDDAERAVRSALAILAAVASLRAPAGESLAARIGIATGLVVAGDLHGDGDARDHAAIGETPNLAARLQGVAEAGHVVVSARTRALIRHLFEVRDLGLQSLKGIADPVPAHAIVSERSSESRFDAHRTGRVAAMVGRDDELSFLMEQWSQASAGAGRLVFVTGEAGIGKSRIVRALQDALEGEPHLRMNYQCSPYHSDSPLFPVVQQLTRAARFGQADTGEQKLEGLKAALGNTASAQTRDIALIAALLGIDAAQHYGPLNLAPLQLRAATFAALISQVVRFAQQQPLLLVVEDAHWIDPTTLELIELFLQEIATIRALVLVTARPDFEHDFGNGEKVARLSLNRLGRTQITAMTSGLARGKSLPPGLLEEIVTKTDGVPLFVEEFTKTILESGLLRETADAFSLQGPLQNLSVPTSLRDSLMARLDRLQPIKEVAQTASCIGREFGFALLASISTLQEEALRDALSRLVDAELLFRKGTPESAQYSFKHALVRDAAYESLLNEKRQHIHARLVTALESVAGTPPELIAQHATLANLLQKAIDCWQKAGAAAIARPAYKEAIAHLTQAIELTRRMGEDRAWQERRLMLLITLGQASIPLRGYGHPDTAAAFDRAQQLVDAMPGAPHRFPIFYAVWVVHYVRGEQDKALDTAQRMVAQAQKDENAGHMLTALRSLAMSQMITGSPAIALESFDQAARLSDALPQRSRQQRIATADRFANEPEIGTRVHFAYTLWCLGEIDRARSLLAQAIADARALGHMHTLCHVLSYSSMLSARCGLIDEAYARSAETVELAERHDLEMLLGYGTVVNAFVLSLKGELEASASKMEAGLTRLAKAHAGTSTTNFYAIQACTLASLHRTKEAEACAAVVRDELRTGSERYYWSEYRRLMGDYLSLCPGGSQAEAEAAYRDALAIARDQRARTWEILAALSLARLWVGRGERRRALELLEPSRAQLSVESELPVIRAVDSMLRELR